MQECKNAGMILFYAFTNFARQSFTPYSLNFHYAIFRKNYKMDFIFFTNSMVTKCFQTDCPARIQRTSSL